MQGRRLPPDESHLPCSPPARHKRRLPGRGVERKGGESPAPAQEHPRHHDTGVKPSGLAWRQAASVALRPLGGRADAVELQQLPGEGKIPNLKGRGGSRDRASRNSLSRHQLDCFRPPAQRLGRWCGDTSSESKAHQSAKCPVAPPNCSLCLCSQHCPDSMTPPALDSSQSSVASKAMTEITSEDYRFWVGLPPFQFPKAL